MKCLASLYNRTRGGKASVEFDVDTVNYGIAFEELIPCIEDSHKDVEVAPVFTLKRPHNLHSIRLKLLGTEVVGCIHSTKPKDRTLGNFLDKEVCKEF